jgi:hypothetical protein
MFNAESAVEILKNDQIHTPLVKTGPWLFFIRGRMNREHGNTVDFHGSRMIFYRRKPPLLTWRNIHNVAQLPLHPRFQLAGSLQALVARAQSGGSAIDVIGWTLGNGRGRLVRVAPETGRKKPCGQEQQQDKRAGNYELNPAGIRGHTGRLYDMKNRKFVDGLNGIARVQKKTPRIFNTKGSEDYGVVAVRATKLFMSVVVFCKAVFHAAGSLEGCKSDQF